jgi:hypothetical protein
LAYPEEFADGGGREDLKLVKLDHQKQHQQHRDFTDLL